MITHLNYRVNSTEIHFIKAAACLDGTMFSRFNLLCLRPSALELEPIESKLPKN